MKKTKNSLQKLVLKNGRFSGGFSSLDVSKLNNIKGGKDAPGVNNCDCKKNTYCSE
ncbi:hypothetical protein [Flavobacterium gelatinilyticum]|uniref:hypothetical protein n=1 Tax=Flavobacterium gelatinilyticum TaxID=3003260 RepID=UPI002480E003|nr:hypothetical protein [Flavobacterium gelatinilyticum]